MSNVIFTIFIDIPDSKIDNPAAWSADGELLTSQKSLIAKYNFQKYKDRLIEAQDQYAKLIKADYIVFGDDQLYKDFQLFFVENYPQISEYDIINFYKHHVMFELAKQYDNVCYFDLDIVPNTTKDIFKSFDLNTFVVPDSNEEAIWGKNVNPKYYNTCIRNPATKYWNAHAMLSEIGINPDQNVYNTGIMIASKDVINTFNYFGNFKQTLDLMTQVKHDQHSMYPKNIQRVFNYDNETVFSYKLASQNIPVTILNKTWHFPCADGKYESGAEFYHVIDKMFARFF